MIRIIVCLNFLLLANLSIAQQVVVDVDNDFAPPFAPATIEVLSKREIEKQSWKVLLDSATAMKEKVTSAKKSPNLGSSDTENFIPFDGKKLDVDRVQKFSSLKDSVFNDSTFNSLSDSLDLSQHVPAHEFESFDEDLNIDDFNREEVLSNQNFNDFSALGMDKSEVLPSISPKKIQSKHLAHLLSIRNQNLKEERIKVKESIVSDTLTNVRLKRREPLSKRTYFEGVLGLINGNINNVAQISPAAGFYITDKLSGGAGVNVLISNKSLNLDISRVGGKLFFKYDIVKGKAYLQLEDIMHLASPSTSISDNAMAPAQLQHMCFVGGGYILNVSEELGFNFALLYDINGVNAEVFQTSSWIFRIGISTSKAKNKSKR